MTNFIKHKYKTLTANGLLSSKSDIANQILKKFVTRKNPVTFKLVTDQINSIQPWFWMQAES